MSPLAQLGHLLAGRLDRFGGHRFTDPAAVNRRTAAAPDSDASTVAVASGDAGPTSSIPPLLVGAGMTNRPGAGLHANNCAYLDIPEHVCVNDAGQPSNIVCLATWYRQTRLHPAGKDIA